MEFRKCLLGWFREMEAVGFVVLVLAAWAWATADALTMFVLPLAE